MQGVLGDLEEKSQSRQISPEALSRLRDLILSSPHFRLNRGLKPRGHRPPGEQDADHRRGPDRKEEYLVDGCTGMKRGRSDPDACVEPGTA